MLHWRIWYDDGSVHEGAGEDAWRALSRHGVLSVRELGQAGNGLVHMGLDYYWHEDGQVRSCSRADLDRYLERRHGPTQVKFGRWASDRIWQQAQGEVLQRRLRGRGIAPARTPANAAPLRRAFLCGTAMPERRIAKSDVSGIRLENPHDRDGQ